LDTCMATRHQFENRWDLQEGSDNTSYAVPSNDIGVFATLTNAYCLTAGGGSENFYRWADSACLTLARLTCCSIFEAELSGEIPIIKTSLAGTRLVGRLSVGQYVCVHSGKGTEFSTSGNKQGLLLPTTTTDQGNFVWTCWLHIRP